MNFKIFFISFCLFLSACHTHSVIRDLPHRATKSKILKVLGQPFKIKRKDGNDHWIYKMVIDGRHYTRTLVIKQGRLYKKGPLKPFSLKKF